MFLRMSIFRREITAGEKKSMPTANVATALCIVQIVRDQGSLTTRPPNADISASITKVITKIGLANQIKKNARACARKYRKIQDSHIKTTIVGLAKEPAPVPDINGSCSEVTGIPAKEMPSAMAANMADSNTSALKFSSVVFN